MTRGGLLALLAAIGAGFGALARHLHGPMGRHVPAGTLVADAGSYDRHSRWLLAGFHGGVARNVASSNASGARVLEVGCGPGRLAIRLAREHGLSITAIDLDPAMIERARANADVEPPETSRRLAFVVADVASLPFPDGSFDTVVSTLSMHHWADAAAALAEIERVLVPGGRALIWDFRTGRVPLHHRLPDPLLAAHRSTLSVASVKPWRWPWRFSLTRRLELVRLAT